MEENCFKEFYNLIFSVVKDIAIQAHQSLKGYNYHSFFKDYPVLNNILPCNMPDYEKYKEAIPYLKFGIQKFDLGEFPTDKIYYSGLFEYFNSNKIEVEKIGNFDKALDFIITNDLQYKLFGDISDEKIKNNLKTMLSDIVVRYLCAIKANDVIPDNIDELLIVYIEEKLSRYFKRLEVDILIPICLATFEDDVIQLTDSIEIRKISAEEQKSRQYICKYERKDENWAASCATHMLVLHKYFYKNDEFTELSNITNNPKSYPLDVIDSTFAIIKLIANENVGYGQLIISPIGWVDKVHEDLMPMYGAMTHNIPPKALGLWHTLEVNYIDSEQAEIIKQLCNVLKSNNKQNLLFALKRYCRCCLREEIDDIIIDVVVAMESLLSGESKTEITYTMANRINVVMSEIDNDKLKNCNYRDLMKKIYGFRSKIVHGATYKEKDKIINIDGKNCEIVDVAKEFLKCILLFILKNPEYLDAKKFDEYIDKKIKTG